MRPFIYLTLLSLISTCPRATSQETYPTNIDLKAAYCLEIKKSAYMLVKDTRGISKELDFHLDELKNEVERLKNFLLTRAPYIDLLPIMASKEAAKVDWKSMGDLTSLCFAKVDKSRPYEEYKVEADECIKTNSTDSIKRLKNCQSLTWLPY